MSIRIGDNNKIKKSSIIDKIEVAKEKQGKRIYETHPFLSGIFVTVIGGIIVGVVLMVIGG